MKVYAYILRAGMGFVKRSEPSELDAVIARVRVLVIVLARPDRHRNPLREGGACGRPIGINIPMMAEGTR